MSCNFSESLTNLLHPGIVASRMYLRPCVLIDPKRIVKPERTARSKSLFDDRLERQRRRRRRWRRPPEKRPCSRYSTIIGDWFAKSSLAERRPVWCGILCRGCIFDVSPVVRYQRRDSAREQVVIVAETIPSHLTFPRRDRRIERRSGGHGQRPDILLPRAHHRESCLRSARSLFRESSPLSILDATRDAASRTNELSYSLSGEKERGNPLSFHECCTPRARNRCSAAFTVARIWLYARGKRRKAGKRGHA